MRAQVEASLSTVGLSGFAERQTHTLSGGQKQRLAIAGALAERPKVHSLPALLDTHSVPFCGHGTPRLQILQM